MYGGIETGGTKTVCAVGSNGTIIERVQFPTGEDPAILVAQIAGFFADRELSGVGLGTFGPCDPDPASPTYGHLLATPKPGWAHVDLIGMLRHRIAAPLTMSTDVTVAALGEWRYGAGRGVADVVYLTIGTGIGAGVISESRILHGRQHPEPGHMRLPFDEPGVCPYHGNCWEGLASGPALAAKLGFPAAEAADEHPIWEYEADVVAAGLHNLTCAVSPRLIIIGGGVGSRAGLHERLPSRLAASLAGYLPSPAISRPALGADAGVIGAMTLAQDHSQG